MACVCEDNDGESRECRHASSPFEDSDRSSVRESVTSDVVRHHEYNKVCNGKQRDDAGVLERVETP
jgi:hypothetical protein